jgi:2-polyprenyl-6-methoxyphenol hydroxylase-like FAD-dependent oxidoreductase
MAKINVESTDVLIVCAGPVGLMLACELRRRDIACCIIDKVSDFPQTSRANGLQPRSMEVLDSLGVADQILARGYPVHGISVRRGGRELFRFETKLDQSGHPPHDPISLIAPSCSSIRRWLRTSSARGSPSSAAR